MDKKSVEDHVKDRSKDLKANHEKKREEINKAADILNEIKLPANCTFYSHGMVWSIRNIAFWESLKQRDEEFMKLINTQLK